MLEGLYKKQVVVFDSGAGGLTIAREIRRSIASIDITYVADNAFFPYGRLTEKALIARVTKVIRDVIKKVKPKYVVVACNTASTLVLEALRNTHNDVEFIGVVPAIKPACQQSTSKHVGLIATKGTVNRDYTQHLIEEFASDCTVHLYASEKLVAAAQQLADYGITDQQVIETELNNLLQQAGNNTIDTVVLGCTHFSLVKDQLETAASQISEQIRFIDSTNAIVNRLASFIKQQSDSREFEDLKRKVSRHKTAVLLSDETATAQQEKYRRIIDEGL